MRTQTKIAVAVGLLGAATMAHAVSISLGGCAAGDGSGLTTCVVGATIVDFNGSLNTLPAGYSDTGGSGGLVVHGSLAGQYAQPGGAGSDTTPYLTATAPGHNPFGQVTASYGGSYNYFGLYWGSMDAYNSLSFYSGASLLSSLTGAQVIAAEARLGDQTEPGSNQYVNFWFGNQTYDTVVFTSTNFAFESDNHAYANVPEPGTLSLLALGLAGVGFMRRRKAA